MQRIPEELQSALSAARAESPYERLGVTPLSSAAERKQAYRALSRLLHPDIIRDPNLRPVCNDALVRVNDAFEILSDPIRELAWRARNSFRMPSNSDPTSSSTRNESSSPPPPSSNPEVRELAELIKEVTRTFSVERLEKATERLIHRLLHARDCRLFIFDPSLRAAAESLVTYVLSTTSDSVALSPAVSLVRLFLFDQAHPLYRQTVATLLARIITFLNNDASLGELDHLFAAARPLDPRASFLHTPSFIEPFSRRLRRALLLCRTDRACEVDRVILLKLQEHYGCLPSHLFTEITQEAYATLLSAAEGPTEAADLRRRLHLGADEALAVITPLLEKALETRDITRSMLYTHLLRFDLSRDREIERQSRNISIFLMALFEGFSGKDNSQQLVLALSFLKQLPDSVRAHLAAKAPLRRAALSAYRRCRPHGAVPPQLHPRALLGASLVDRLCCALFFS